MTSASRIKAAPTSAKKNKSPGKRELLTPGARAVHPQHGVVEIVGIVEREVDGKARHFCELKLVASAGRVLLPVPEAGAAKPEALRLRPIMSAAEADALIAFIKEPPLERDSRPFQKRMRAYGDMLRSGERQAVAEVLREMVRAAATKPLSFGERKLHAQARTMLVTELAIAKATTDVAIDEQLAAAFAA